MRLISDILEHRSLAIVGLEKNTGKTECLNYVLRNLPENCRTAVTSIGTDGENRDIVTHTAKPEIYLREGTVFATTEKYYRQRRLVSRILSVGDENTALGRIVTAEAVAGGKVLLSGPSSAASLRRWMDSLGELGVRLTVIDGALSRLSSASPAVSEAMILSTGAALSADMNTLVRETAFRVELINLPLAEDDIRRKLSGCGHGIWTLDNDGVVVRLDAASPLSARETKTAGPDNVRAMYAGGALTPRFLAAAGAAGGSVPPEIVVADFTKIFLSSRDYRLFLARGGRISVMERSRLLAVCVNPTAPNGMALNPRILFERMSEAVPVPVYDIMRCDEV